MTEIILSLTERDEWKVKLFDLIQVYQHVSIYSIVLVVQTLDWALKEVLN